MRKHLPQARQILSKMLRERLTFTPETRGAERGYRFTGEGSLMPLLAGSVSAFSHLQAVASLMPASWNRVAYWLQQIDGLRRAA